MAEPMTSNIQPAGVAGLFYPAEADRLAADVDASLARANPPRLAAKAVIAPHAGHIYSGDIAGEAYALLAPRRGEIKRVILMGPAHRMAFRGLALAPARSWATPLGEVAVDQEGFGVLAAAPGVAVAEEPFLGEHSLEVHLPFIQRALGDVAVLPVLVGHPQPGQTAEALSRLWGGPETAIVVSSDLSHFHDYETCRAKDAETTAGIERLSFAACESHRACGFFGIAGLLDQAQRRDLRATALDVRNSGDTQGGRERVVGYGAFAFEQAHGARLEPAARRSLLQLAKAVIQQAAAHGGRPPNLNINSPLPRPLLAQRATFVTLSINGQLRGCRGSIAPQRSLIHDVADNAWQSAYGDPRFPPLSPAELERLDVHISILSTPRRMAVASEADLVRAIQPDVEGLVIRDGDRKSLFLPSVWAQIPDPLAFVRQLKLKAGLPADYWSDRFEAFRFEAESFGEADVGG